MFQQLNNIDKGFKHIKAFSLALIAGCTAIAIYSVYKSHTTLANAKDKIYILAADKLLQAVASNRAEHLYIEIKDHIKTFHANFFALEPDHEVIKHNINKALNLANESANAEYRNLVEKGYYSGIVSANISQKVADPDSVVVNMNPPYAFRYYSKLRIIRTTSIVTRSLVTEGTIRITTPSDINPHGLMIENWRILDNTDLSTEKR